MNPNDLMAQEQEMASQIPSMVFHFYLFVFAIQIIASGLGGWVIYMFYARLRDISTEVKKLRVAYERSNPVAAKQGANQPATPTPPVNPDARYLPKKWEL